MKIEINILQYKEYSSELSIMSGTVHETPLSSSSSSSSAPGGGMTIDIRPMIEDVSQVMTKHITSILTGVIGEYTIYKETHDTIMGLPCVRKLQDRIMELEQMGGGGVRGSSVTTNSREDEIAQLQSAIVDLNRYIHALESKVDMKSVASSGAGGSDANRPEEESVKLEVHENEQQQEEEDGEEDEEDDVCVVSSTTHKNVIVTADALVEDEEAEADEEEESEEEEEADAEEEVVEADEEEAADEADEAPAEEEEEAAEEEDAGQEEGDEEAADAEEAEAEEAEEAEDAEEADVAEEDDAVEDAEEEAEVAAEEEEAEVAVEEEETEEVEEVKIKGKTYFTTDPQNGIIYACVDDDVGDEVGVFKNGVAIFNKGKK